MVEKSIQWDENQKQRKTKENDEKQKVEKNKVVGKKRKVREGKRRFSQCSDGPCNESYVWVPKSEISIEALRGMGFLLYWFLFI